VFAPRFGHRPTASDAVRRPEHQAGGSLQRAISVAGLTAVGLLVAACGSGRTPVPETQSPAAPASTNSAQPTVTLSEWKVDVPATMRTGSYTFTIANAGKAEHELLVFKSDLPLAQYPRDAGGDIVEDASGITKVSDGDNIAAGKSQSRVIDLSVPGTYVFVCNIPGHVSAGMSAVVKVTAAPEPQQPISLTEWQVTAPHSLKAGKYNLVISNEGKVDHELLVFKSDLAPNKYPLESTGNIAEDGPGITKVSDGDNIAPGKGQTRVVDLSAPGTYLFVCNIPSHFTMGMYSVVTVTS